MSGSDYLLLIVLMGLVTYLPRWLPLAILAQRKMPSWLISWLSFIPAAIMASLLVPGLLLSYDAAGAPRFCFTQPGLWVAVPTFLFAIRTKSLGGTVLVGMLLFWLAGRLNFFG